MQGRYNYCLIHILNMRRLKLGEIKYLVQVRTRTRAWTWALWPQSLTVMLSWIWFPHKRTPRQGFKYRQFVWELIPENTSEGRGVAGKERPKKDASLSNPQLGATGAQSHQGPRGFRAILPRARMPEDVHANSHSYLLRAAHSGYQLSNRSGLPGMWADGMPAVRQGFSSRVTHLPRRLEWSNTSTFVGCHAESPHQKDARSSLKMMPKDQIFIGEKPFFLPWTQQPSSPPPSSFYFLGS